MLVERLKELKDKHEITVQQWSDMSNVPAATINRILQGGTENPGIVTISAMVYPLGGSLDALFGREPVSEETLTRLKTLYDEGTSEMRLRYETRIQELHQSCQSQISRLNGDLNQIKAERDSVLSETTKQFNQFREANEMAMTAMREEIEDIKKSRNLVRNLLIAMVIILIVLFIALLCVVIYDFRNDDVGYLNRTAAAGVRSLLGYISSWM